jgi:tyrosine-protein kinase Etk/Wzc
VGRRTFAIEADLRSPRFARELDLEPSAGLAGILADGRPLAEEMSVLPLGVGRGVPGGALPGGAAAPMPLPLLAGPRMAAVIAEARRLASIVVLAGPPTDDFADSLALAAQADAVLLVARVDATSRAELQRARVAFEQLDLHLAGVVAAADRPVRGGGRPARPPGAAPAVPANGAAHETPEVIAK